MGPIFHELVLSANPVFSMLRLFSLDSKFHELAFMKNVGSLNVFIVVII